MNIGDYVYYIRDNKIKYGCITEEDSFHFYFGKRYDKVDKTKVFELEEDATSYLASRGGMLLDIWDWLCGK